MLAQAGCAHVLGCVIPVSQSATGACAPPVVAVCGDGTLEGSEQCDDGNLVAGDGCDASCVIELAPVCGDGTLAGAEQCDDGNLVAGDGCDASCQLEAIGGVLVGSFAISDGPTWSDPTTMSLSCTDACALLFGGAASAYDCSTDPAGPNHHAFVDGYGDEQFCSGAGVPEDFRSPADGSAYDCGGTSCSFSAYVNDHGCAGVNYCFTTTGRAFCGDGFVGRGEVCDDGNPFDGDGCDADCQPSNPPCLLDADCGGAVGSCVAGTCADSITRWSEGSVAWPDQACNPDFSFGGCNTNDQAHADEWAGYVCRQNGWAYGRWTGNKLAGCAGEQSMYCAGQLPCQPQLENSCQAGDQTQVEFTCSNVPIDVCADGLVTGGEQCDDGNPNPGDGCDGSCRAELP